MKITSLTDTISLKRQLEGGNEEQLKTVRRVLQDVRENGDAALRKYSEMWDGILLDDFRVTQNEIDNAVLNFDPQLKQDLEEAAANIRYYHEAQKRDGYKLPLDNGSWLGQRIIPLDAVGLYVPGGLAAYPSSVLMNVIPAQVAGLSELLSLLRQERMENFLMPCLLQLLY